MILVLLNGRVIDPEAKLDALAELAAEHEVGTCNERHRMVRHFSKNLVHWCFAGLVAKGANRR